MRHTVPGVALISPPPHHDIYSIEDLAQLIYDLKQINAEAKVSVKLVSQAGVGTIAAGVAKALADVVADQRTFGRHGRFSPLSSIKNAGLPWELGLAETQQTLLTKQPARAHPRARRWRHPHRQGRAGGCAAGRGRVLVRHHHADRRGLHHGAGACHLNTCPTGVATQKPELAREVRGQTRTRDGFPALRGTGRARAPGRDGLSQPGRTDRPE